MLTRTLTGLPLATLAPSGLNLRPMPAVRAPATIDRALTVVLERTRRGDEELIQHRFGLGAARWQLLAAIDGKHPLGQLDLQGADFTVQRRASDAARLVAFGLCRAVSGELPRSMMVAAMNLTMRLPRALIAADTRQRPDTVDVDLETLDEIEGDRAIGPLQVSAAVVIGLLLAWIALEVVLV